MAVPTVPGAARSRTGGPPAVEGFVSWSTADRWDAGLVTGTGRTGAVLHGGPARHVVDLAHEEFFTALHDRPRAPATAGVLPQVRERLLAGDADGAAAAADRAVRASDVGDRLVWTDPLAPAATLVWTPRDGVDGGGGEGRASGGRGEHDGYRREVDLRSGEASVRWRAAHGATGVAVLPVRAADAFLVRLTCGTVDGVLTLGRTGETRAGGPGTASGPTPAGGRARARVVAGEGELHVEVSPTGDFTDTVARTVLVAGDGTDVVVQGVDEGGIRARVTAATEVATLAVAVDVHGPGVPPAAVPAVDRCREVLADPAAARARQERGHGGLVGRTALRLGGDRVAPDLGDLAAELRRGDARARLVATEVAFAAGRHTILSSTGVLPPTLQGVWQGTWAPAWSSDYTMNGNVQSGAAAGGVVTGCDEVVPALFRLVARFADDYADNARRVYGAGGWLLPARCTTHGRASHTNHRYPHHWWVGNGPWTVRLGYDHWSATGDEEFLRDALWPLVQNVLEFCCDVVVAGEGGRVHVVPSYSPENTPAGAGTPLAVDATSDVAMLRDAARLGQRLARLVPGADPERVARWAGLVAALPPYRVRDGAFAEWIGDGFDDQVAHRHASHLYPFWYEDDDRVGPAERAAALEAIRRRLDWRAEDPTGPPGRMEMAFGLVQLGVAAARLGAAEEALRCVSWLAELHWGTNGVSTHDAGAIFNVDASGGLPALVAAMLLEAQPNRVTLLPACPDAWPAGEVAGLRGRGGLVVDRLAWTAGHVEVTARFAPGTGRTRDGDVVDLRVGAGPARAERLGADPRTIRLPRP